MQNNVNFHMKIKIHFHVLLNIIRSPIFFIVFCFDAYLTILLHIKNIFPYIIIESKMQHISLPKNKINILTFLLTKYILYITI